MRPKSRAPSPSGMPVMSKSDTVASVRMRMLTHMGRMKSNTIVLERLNSLLLSMYAAG